MLYYIQCEPFVPIMQIFAAAGKWSSWDGDCDVTCGKGTRYLTRTCEEDPDYPPQGDCDVHCEGDDKKEEECYEICCPRMENYNNYYFVLLD